MCPTEAILKKKWGVRLRDSNGTVLEPGLLNRTILCYFITNYNFSALKFTNLLLWPNQDNDLTYVCAKQHFATMHVLKTIFFIP